MFPRRADEVLRTLLISSRRFFCSSIIRSSGPSERRLPKDKWNYNKSSIYEPAPVDSSNYKIVTARDLKHETSPPRRVKMLTRDFIEDSLYNPSYGYFSKHATIVEFNSKPLEFSNIKNGADFEAIMAKGYAEHDRRAQLWHTPSELFKVSRVICFEDPGGQFHSPGMVKLLPVVSSPSICSSISHMKTCIYMSLEPEMGHWQRTFWTTCVRITLKSMIEQNMLR
jgi:hypothetical protein